MRHGFDATGPAKHVHALHLFQGVASLAEQGCVPGKGSRVAGNVNNPFRGGLGHGINDGGFQSLAWGIDDHDLRTQTALHQPGQQFLRRCAVEVHIADAVMQGVCFGVLNGLGNNFHPQDLTAAPCQHQGDGASAAVQVAHQLVAAQLGKLQCQTVKGFRLRGIDLKKAGRMQLKAGAAELIL